MVVTAALAAFEGVGVLFGGRVRALDDVTLLVPRGGILGLVGESGSGKTTLCRTLLGLTPVTEGRVTFDGGEVGARLAADPRGFRRRVQMLLQDAVASLSPRMTIGRALEEPLRIHGLPLPRGGSAWPACSAASACRRMSWASTRTRYPAARPGASASRAPW